VQLAASTIGIGGQGDPTGANIPNKLNRHVVPNGFTYIPVNYPAGIDIDNSVAAGVPVLDQTIKKNSNQFLLVVGYSEGATVAEKVRRELVPNVDGAPPLNPDGPDPTEPGLLFVMIATQNIGNGGIFARLPHLTIPFIVTSNGPAQPSPYNTTYVTNEYDTYADFPAYFNLLSLANTLAAVWYVHPDQYYNNSIDYDPLAEPCEDPGSAPVLVKTVTNSADGTDSYVFVPAAHLPLLAPARQVFAAVGLTPLTEPVLSAVEPVLRLLVDMGYTDRENLNPEVHVKFSLMTPPKKIVETIAKLPGAIAQGANNNFVTGVESIHTSVPAPVTPTKSPAISARQLPEEKLDSLVDNNPFAAGATDPAAPQTPSGSGTSGSGTSQTEAPVSTLSNSGPTLEEVTEDGNKATPNTSSGKTTSPKKNVFKQLADTVKGFVGGKKKPGASTPSSEPNDATPSGSTSQGQSEGPTSNAA
jgi:PE-PPE domain